MCSCHSWMNTKNLNDKTWTLATTNVQISPNCSLQITFYDFIIFTNLMCNVQQINNEF
jgi:hypothetical protein